MGWIFWAQPKPAWQPVVLGSTPAPLSLLLPLHAHHYFALFLQFQFRKRRLSQAAVEESNPPTHHLAANRFFIGTFSCKSKLYK